MLSRDDIINWLREDDPARLATLWQMADAMRAASVGDAVHLRGLVEISSFCRRQCLYCGLRAGNTRLERYRMSAEEICAAAEQAVAMGYGTLVMQAGEDACIGADWLAEVVARIKASTPLAVTLSLGERDDDELRLWRAAGADRYLLRFETSDARLYRVIHPALANTPSDRIAMLRRLREMGYEAGSGIMVGIPGQTIAGIADDLLLMHALDLDMIGIGPYIAHPHTPLGSGQVTIAVPADQQAPAGELLAYKAMALARLLCPQANIPATTALATLNRSDGRELALQRGANVVMPNLTPVRYRALYEIYPNKACVDETAKQCNGCLRARIARIGRHVGSGPGGRQRGARAAS